MTSCYCPQYEQYLLRQAAASALVNGSNVERLGENKDAMFIRFFVINDKVNGRGWSVNPSTMQKNIETLRYKPVILYKDASGRLDHPEYSNRNASDIADQECYKIGTIERIFHAPGNNSYYADAKITSPSARNFIRNFADKKIPLTVSSQIIYDSLTEPPNYYSNYFYSHIAIVDKPAYGPDAKVVGICNSYSDNCDEKLPNQIIPSTPSAAASASQLENFANTWLPKQPLNGKIPRKLA